MKKISASLLAVLFIAAFAAPPSLSAAAEKAGGDFVRHPRELVYPELKFSIPSVQRIVLKNGMVVHLLEDHTVPYLSVKAYIQSGSAWDPPQRGGLARLTALSMRAAGTKRFPADTLNQRLEILAAAMSSSSDKDMAQADLWTLSRVSGETLDMFFSMLREPAFEPGKTEIERQKLLDAVRRQNDSPRELTPREFTRLVYGGHPYGNPETGSAASLKAIAESDLRAFHARHYRPENIILAVAGDVKKDSFLKTLERLTAGWGGEGGKVPPIPKVPEQPFKPGIYYLEKPLTQTNLRMGHLGLRRGAPDYFDAQVMNAILGGGLSFSSRLVSRIRTREGLAYSVGSRFSDLNDIGIFFCSTQTRAEKTHYTVTLMKEEIERMRSEPVSDKELNGARETLINRLPFTFDSAEAAAQAFAELEYQGLPADYYQSYAAKIRAVTKESVLAAARKYIRPDNWVLLVVGSEKAFDKPFAEWGGTVTRVQTEEESPEEETLEP